MAHRQDQVEIVDARVKAALKESGCPICRIVLEDLRRYWFWYTVESYGEAPVLAELAEAQGFCYLHTQQLLEHTLPYQTAFIYQYLIGRLLPEVEKGPQPTRGSLLARLLRWLRHAAPRLFPSKGCPICTRICSFEGYAVNALATYLKTAEGQSQLMEADGLCLPHFRRVASRIDGTPEADALWVRQFVLLRELERDLAELQRKYDYRFREEPAGQEQDAWQRAARFFAGGVPYCSHQTPKNR
jgi:hypothetical protein